MELKYKLASFIPDKLFLSLKYYKNFRKPLNWRNPQTFNEKLNWLKLYDRNPLYTSLVDKYEVKKIVADKIGDQYIIPTLGVWDKAEDIDFDSLPDQFVLKANHDSGHVIICKDKTTLDKSKAIQEMKDALQRDFYAITREWPYKNVKRKIIAESLLQNNNGTEIIDYKFMCFNGNVKCSFVCSERQENLKVTFFDNDWNVMPFERHYPKSTVPIQKPSCFDLMVRLSERLSDGIPFVRVDFYEVNGNVYFGEMTFFPGGGVEEFTPSVWDLKLGQMIDLPAKRKQ